MGQAACEQRWPWYFCGPAGRGKTFIAAACYRHWHGKFAVWLGAGETLMNYVMDRGTAGKICSTVRDASLIVLDDIGVREPTGAQLDALLMILELRTGKPLILTGNNSHEELLKQRILDERCVSRICGGQTFDVQGSDRRLDAAKLFEI